MRAEKRKRNEKPEGLAIEIPSVKKETTRQVHLALPKRRPDSHYWGRPYQDRVRSVIIVRQDRQDSRDQQPRRASSRWTACRTLGSVAAGQSLSCLYQVVRVRSTEVDPPATPKRHRARAGTQAESRTPKRVCFLFPPSVLPLSHLIHNSLSYPRAEGPKLCTAMRSYGRGKPGPGPYSLGCLLPGIPVLSVQKSGL